MPAELRPPPADAPPASGCRALRRRHLLREQRAKEFFAASRSPERGWPVADNDAVVRVLRPAGPAPARARSRRWSCSTRSRPAAALLVPRLLGNLVDRTVADDTSRVGGRRSLALVIRRRWCVAQSLFTFAGQLSSTLLGQDVLASAREYIVGTILRLPLGRVEGASTGDLVTRVTRDVGTMSRSVQYGVPDGDHRAAHRGAHARRDAAATPCCSPCPSLVLMGSSLFQVRRYLVRAPKGYLTEGATYSRINTTLTETVEGARTVEALGLTGRRVAAPATTTSSVSAQAERYTMTLRNLLFAVIDVAFNVPRVLTLLVGAFGYAQGWATLGQITTAVLYVEALCGPLDRLVGKVDRLQVGVASTTRLLGIATGAARPRGRRRPARTARTWSAEDLRFAYREGHDVLHGIDLTCARASGSRSSARRGSGKSTLGRLLVGHQRSAHRLGHGRRGRADLAAAGACCAPRSPWSPRSTTSSSGRCATTSCSRARTPPTTRSGRRSRAVDSADWVAGCPSGLDTMVGSGQQPLTPAQAQQIALARLIIADPHTLVLDEATSLIDPRTARTLEGSMNALLSGRTVVAIAHRLHTAHDADRIAVVIDGRIAELGSHDELVEREDGEYAALWRAWTS